MKKLLILISIIFTGLNLNAQGCSDAGICYFSNNSSSESKLKNNLDFGYIYGKGLEDVTYNSFFVAYNRNMSDKFSLSAKINYNQANGSFGTLGHFGDAFLIGKYILKTQKQSELSVSFGTKMPFTLGNLKINEYAVPLDYQPSLGTFDALLGVDYKYNNWNFDVAMQLPVFQTNKNSYFDEYSASNDFPTTNFFRRKPDLLTRATYKIAFEQLKKFTFKPNLLAIYHLGNDTYEDIFGKRQTIENSNGLTLNANLIVDYMLNKNNFINFSIATPLVVRDIRPDGLTRSLTIGLTYSYHF